MPRISLRKRSSSLLGEPEELPQDIPDVALQRAFRAFSDPSQEIRDLSKHWTSVKDYPFIWINLVFRGGQTDTDYICFILQNAPMLESLELIKVPRVETILRQLCRSRHQLKHLSIRFCHSGENMEHMVSIPEATLRHVIQSCPRLMTLDIEGTPFQGRLFYEELPFLRRLRSLRMGNNSLLRSRNIQSVATACRGRLTHFCLMQCPEGPPPPVYIYYPALPASRQEWKAAGRTRREFEKPVNMGSLPLTSSDCDLLLRMLGPSLKVLELDTAGVDLWALQGLLNYCSGLYCLCLLNAKNVSGELVRAMPASMPRLSYLVLRGSPLVTDDDLSGFLERGGEEDGAEPEEVPSVPEGGEEGQGVTKDPEKEWWEWGFWSDHEEEESDEEDPELKNAATSQEPDDEEGDVKGKKVLRPRMNTLDVGMCPFITDGFLRALCRSPVAGQLRRLGLRGCQLVTDEGLGALLESCGKLRHLDVSFVGGGDGPGPGWLASASSGDSLPLLESLVVGWQNDKDVGGERKSSLARMSGSGQGLQVKRRLSRFSGRLVDIP